MTISASPKVLKARRARPVQQVDLSCSWSIVQLFLTPLKPSDKWPYFPLQSLTYIYWIVPQRRGNFPKSRNRIDWKRACRMERRRYGCGWRSSCGVECWGTPGVYHVNKVQIRYGHLCSFYFSGPQNVPWNTELFKVLWDHAELYFPNVQTRT